MIAFHREAGIAPGKTGQALAFAHEISAYMKDAYNVSLDVMQPVGGNPQRICWDAKYDDLAAFEKVSSKLTGDKRYWEIVGKATECFVAGSMQDTIWRTV